MNLGEIESKTRHRSNLLIHFKDEISAENMFKIPDFKYKDIPITIDEFSPTYRYDIILFHYKDQYDMIRI